MYRPARGRASLSRSRKIELLSDRPPAPLRELIAERDPISLVALGL
jgi:hypothetical protein